MCSSSEVFVEVQSGMHAPSAPADAPLQACIIRVNGVVAVDGTNCARGLNVVVIHGKSGAVREVSNFDTFAESGYRFQQYVSTLSSDDIVAVTSFDDAFNSLGPRGRGALRKLGSTLVDGINYRGNIALIGRRELWYAYAEKASAAEHTATTFGWGAMVNVSACVDIGKMPKLSQSPQRSAARVAFCRGTLNLRHPLCRFEVV